MEFVFDFIHVDNADAIIIWCKHENNDLVIFLDGGKTGDGEKVITHFNNYIRPHLSQNARLGFINSHPHNDHIKGLIEIVEYFGSNLKFAVYNDPVEFISAELKGRIYEYYQQKADPDIVHLYETFQDIQRLNALCQLHNIVRYSAFSDSNEKFSGFFKILSPSREYYSQLVRTFTDLDHLFKEDYSQKTSGEVNELEEDNKPCAIVDELNDASPENLSSTVIEFTNSSGQRYLLTGDAGVDSFNQAENNGFNLEGFKLVQLPHHGSRRNVNTNWLCKFAPDYYIASASGSHKHPRRAVVNCIKRNLPNCQTYSTHTDGKAISYTTNQSVFPNRGWADAKPL